VKGKGSSEMLKWTSIWTTHEKKEKVKEFSYHELTSFISNSGKIKKIIILGTWKTPWKNM